LSEGEGSSVVAHGHSFHNLDKDMVVRDESDDVKLQKAAERG
jgi:hypothetical protein